MFVNTEVEAFNNARKKLNFLEALRGFVEASLKVFLV